MAFTVAQLTAIETAIAAGETEVTFEGKTVKYASMADLTARYNFIRAKLVSQGDLTDTRVRTSYAAHSKA